MSFVYIWPRLSNLLFYVSKHIFNILLLGVHQGHSGITGVFYQLLDKLKALCFYSVRGNTDLYLTSPQSPTLLSAGWGNLGAQVERCPGKVINCSTSGKNRTDFHQWIPDFAGLLHTCYSSGHIALLWNQTTLVSFCLGVQTNNWTNLQRAMKTWKLP